MNTAYTILERASYNEYADAYMLTKSMVNWFWNNHVPNLEQRTEIHASPLQASIDQLKDLPPVHIQVAEMTCYETKESPMRLNSTPPGWRSRWCAMTP
jgi:acetyl esterase/lipase